ncbi:MAG: hypothetical protein KatS3mg105_4711 [Gemmatales bacterium]|nr:MAG: hypothetical protein KatS3mg105_4711 [Gemmatales bacterium]
MTFGSTAMTPEAAMEQINTVCAHAWMVRTFLKHADEIQDDADMLAVPRMIFDFVRALEPSYQRKDADEYLRRARGKLGKLKRVADYFASEYANVSSHTNFEMAARSLAACVAEIEEVLAAATKNMQRPFE